MRADSPFRTKNVQNFLINLLAGELVPHDEALMRACSLGIDADEGDDDWNPPELIDARSFRDAGLLTRDRGVVLSFDCDREFQLTIVRSR